LSQRWDAEEIANAITRYLTRSRRTAGHWAWGNHDFYRLTSRATEDQLRVGAMLLLTLQGTPLIYYGEEIGMCDVEIPPELVEDPQGKTQPTRNRDVARTPMQWNHGPNAGFTTGKPFFPIAENYRLVNVESQERDPRSLLAVYRRLIAFRRSWR
jgi:alpha-glucosidase